MSWDWTQEEAARELAPYLGVQLLTASFSAIERSVDTGRVRECSADELLAFAWGSRVPVTWFFTPPSVWEGVGVSTPDAARTASTPSSCCTPSSARPRRSPTPGSTCSAGPIPHPHAHAPSRTMENLGRLQQDVHPMLDDLLRLQARRQLRDRFGDVDQARDVLNALTALLDELDDPTLGVAETDKAQQDTRAKRRADGDATAPDA
jgi:hypothetical protein